MSVALIWEDVRLALVLPRRGRPRTGEAPVGRVIAEMNTLRTRRRRLDPGQQALLVVAHLRKAETYRDLAEGFGIGISTVYRYLPEGLELLAAMAPNSRRGGRGRAAQGLCDPRRHRPAEGLEDPPQTSQATSSVKAVQTLILAS